jgi:hypothetical protein
LRDDRTVGAIPIAGEVARRLVPRECLGDLARDPLRGRIRGHVGPDQLSPIKVNDDKALQQFEADRRCNEEVDGGNVGRMIAQERPCDGGPRRRPMYFATDDCEISMPSFSNSP